MSNLYNPAAAEGTEFSRCYQVVIDNPHNGSTVATFQEERVLVSAAGPDRHWATGECRLPYSPETAIPILDPETGADTGAVITMAALYGLLYSAYLHAATARDAAGGAA